MVVSVAKPAPFKGTAMTDLAFSIPARRILPATGSIRVGAPPQDCSDSGNRVLLGGLQFLEQLDGRVDQQFSSAGGEPGVHHLGADATVREENP
jgi:hypothetical protein